MRFNESPIGLVLVFYGEWNRRRVNRQPSRDFRLDELIAPYSGNSGIVLRGRIRLAVAIGDDMVENLSSSINRSVP